MSNDGVSSHVWLLEYANLGRQRMQIQNASWNPPVVKHGNGKSLINGGFSMLE